MASTLAGFPRRARRVSTRGSRGSHSTAGFSLVEILVAVVIIGILVAVVAPRLINRIGDAKTGAARSQIASLVTALNTYRIDCGEPEAGADLSILWERPSSVAESAWKGPYIENADVLIDPWGTPYALVIPPQHNADFDIVSYGADKVPGGEGEAADIVSGKRAN